MNVKALTYLHKGKPGNVCAIVHGPRMYWRRDGESVEQLEYRALSRIPRGGDKKDMDGDTDYFIQCHEYKGKTEMKKGKGGKGKGGGKRC